MAEIDAFKLNANVNCQYKFHRMWHVRKLDLNPKPLLSTQILLQFVAISKISEGPFTDVLAIAIFA